MNDFMNGYCTCHHKPVVNVSTRECDLDGCMYNECENWKDTARSIEDTSFPEEMPFGILLNRDPDQPWLLRR